MDIHAGSVELVNDKFVWTRCMHVNINYLHGRGTSQNL